MIKRYLLPLIAGVALIPHEVDAYQPANPKTSLTCVEAVMISSFGEGVPGLATFCDKEPASDLAKKFSPLAKIIDRFLGASGTRNPIANSFISPGALVRSYGEPSKSLTLSTFTDLQIECERRYSFFAKVPNKISTTWRCRDGRLQQFDFYLDGNRIIAVNRDSVASWEYAPDGRPLGFVGWISNDG